MGERVDTKTAAKTDSVVLLFLGCERSGTTFVQETLEKFYPVSPGNESQWAVEAWERAHGFDPHDRGKQIDFIKSVLAGWYFANKANYHQVYFDYKKFIQEPPFDYGRFVEAIFSHIAETDDNKWVLNKTCMFCENMAVVDKVFDKPRVVHIVRDGRDVALSLLRVKAWGPISPFGAARWWSQRVEAMQRYAGQYMDGRILEIKYEEVLQAPVEAFERIAKFYGIYEQERHDQLSQHVKIMANNSEKWRKAMTPAELEVFERVAGKTLVANGYQLATEPGRLKPVSGLEKGIRAANEAVFARIGFYPLWFRGLKILNRVIGAFPRFQQAFYRSRLFNNYFNWNKNMDRVDRKE